MTFEMHLAAFALGKVRVSELPDVATQGLVEGYESAALGALAGSTSEERSTSELLALFNESLRDLGCTVPSRLKAATQLKGHYCSLVFTGELPPREGARRVVELSRDMNEECPDKEYAGDGFGIARLLGLYYNHDEVPPGDKKSHAELDREIREECGRLVTEANDAV